MEGPMPNWKYIHNDIYILTSTCSFFATSTAEATSASQQCHGIYTIISTKQGLRYPSHNSHTICSLGKH